MFTRDRDTFDSPAAGEAKGAVALVDENSHAMKAGVDYIIDPQEIEKLRGMGIPEKSLVEAIEVMWDLLDRDARNQQDGTNQVSPALHAGGSLN